MWVEIGMGREKRQIYLKSGLRYYLAESHYFPAALWMVLSGDE